MTLTEYAEKREALRAEYEAAIKRGDPDAMQKYMEAVSKLDAEYWRSRKAEQK